MIKTINSVGKTEASDKDRRIVNGVPEEVMFKNEKRPAMQVVGVRTLRWPEQRVQKSRGRKEIRFLKH